MRFSFCDDNIVNVQLCLQNGVTALYVASRNGHFEVVNILLQNGAHVDVRKEVRN